jgi:hypothetical protein
VIDWREQSKVVWNDRTLGGDGGKDLHCVIDWRGRNKVVVNNRTFE